MKFVVFFLGLLAASVSGTKLGECEADCDTDSDCKVGLLCADEHKDALEAAGLDRRRAYCGGRLGGWSDEVCFDPNEVIKVRRSAKPVSI